jgi:hypothetical protein
VLRTGAKSAPKAPFAAAEIYDTDGFGPSRARAACLRHRPGPPGAVGDSHRGAPPAQGGYSGHFASAGVLRLSDIESGAVSALSPLYDPSQGGASTPHRSWSGEIKRTTAATPASGSRHTLVLRTLRLRRTSRAT